MTTDCCCSSPGRPSGRISTASLLIKYTWIEKFSFNNLVGVGIMTLYKQCIQLKHISPEHSRAPGSPAGYWLGSHRRGKDTSGTFPVPSNLPNSCFQYTGDLGKQSKIIPWESKSHGYEKSRRRREVVFNRVISFDPWWVLFYFILKMK